ncbi:hypothetical protein Rs2_11228 [Raphanus sativus]|nr:hypothetical protein Rs2_11228 [Raphanus sativus]
MLIHRTSLIAPVLEDYKRQTLRGADGVDMLLLDSKVELFQRVISPLSRPVSSPIPNKCDWETEPAELDFPNSAMIRKIVVDGVGKQGLVEAFNELCTVMEGSSCKFSSHTYELLTE